MKRIKRETLKHPAFYPSHLLRQPPRDLFGEVPVTEDDIYEWVSRVSPAHLGERSFPHYVRGYDVAGKIRTHKLRGLWEPLLNQPHRDPMHAILTMCWRN